MKKLFLKILLYSVIILSIPYFYLLFQAKQGVDSFLAAHPMDGKFVYEWLWVDQHGKITIQDIKFYQDSSKPIFTAKKIEIVLTSVFDLLDAREHIIYKEYPSDVFINIFGGATGQSDKVFGLLNLNYSPVYVDYIYPNTCSKDINHLLPFMHFNLRTHFEIHRTSDLSQIEFRFESSEFANIQGSFILNNFTEQGGNVSFVSDLTANFSNLTWIQQNTQKCLHALKLKKPEFSVVTGNYISNKAKENSFVINNQALDALVNFVYIPQEIQLAFNLQNGLTLSQASILPNHEYPEKSGLQVSLNRKVVDISLLEHKNLVEIKSEPLVPEVKKIEISNKEDDFLRVNAFNLKKHLGEKMKISLDNKKVIIGYLEMANEQGIKISQIKHKGKVLLPFSYNNIESIALMNTKDKE